MDCKLHRRGLILLLCCWSVINLAAQNWRDSLAVLNRQLQLQPSSLELHLRKAAVNMELKQWEYASDEYSLVLEREPRNLAALFYRAYADVQLRRYDQARRGYEDVIAQVPGHLEARLGLALVCQQTGHTTEAMDHYNRLVEMFPDSAMVYVARANMERELKAYDSALYDWQQAVRKAPRNTDYLISEADVLLLMGRKAEARALLDRAVALGVARGALREWYSRCR